MERQIRAFVVWLSLNSCTHWAQLLWFHLAAAAPSFGTWFEKSSLSLISVMNVAENTFKAARSELKANGLIDFVPSSTRGKFTRYKVVRLYLSVDNFALVSTVDTQTDTQMASVSMVDTQTDTQMASDKSLPYEIYRDDLRDDLSVADSDVKLERIFTALSRVSPIENRKDKNFALELARQYPVDWILAAVDLAVDNSAYTLLYVDKILSNWRKAGFADHEKPWLKKSVGRKKETGIDILKRI